MANGFFLGGAAEGISSANKQDLAERTLTADTDLRRRGIEIQQQTADRLERQSVLERADKAVADTMATVGEVIKAGVAAGKDANTIMKAVTPLVQSAKQIGAKVGKDPTALDAQVQALLAQPTMTEAATAAGTAEGIKRGTSAIAEAKVLTGAGVDPDATKWKEPKDRVSAENALRDDYIKNSSDYIKIRDAKNRIDTVEDTGAGDIALVFQYMKILDPGSTVREGEFATASNAAGVPSAVLAQYNKLLGGGLLDTKARKEIRQQADKLYSAQAAQHDKMTTKFADIAKRQNLRVDNVIVDLSPAERKATFNDRFGATGAIPPPPPGFNLIK